MKLLKNEKLVIKLFLAITSVAGLCSFLVVVKLIGVDPESQKLPLYQGLSAYYSMISFGFLYLKNRNSIYGKKILPALVVMYLVPVCYYYYSRAPFSTVLFFSIVIFLTNASIFINIALQNRVYYLIQQLLASIFLPSILILENYQVIVLCMALVSFFMIQISVNRSKLNGFSFTQTGTEFFKSILLQSVLFLLPMIDVKIVESIGPKKYENYTLISKISTGVWNYIFSYMQFKLLFDKKLSNKKLYEYILLALAIATIAMSLVDANLIFAVLIIVFGFGNNVSSLLLRNNLTNGVSFYEALLGPLSLLCYYIFISVYSDFLAQHPNIFLSAMFVCITVPALVIGISLRQPIKVK